MCGIVGFTGKERAVPYLLDCLSSLEYRGYDSAGIALSTEKGIEITKCQGKLSVLSGVLASKRKSDSFCGIGHTRWATHGAPDEKNAHPHMSQNGIFAVVHNGIIENYAEIKSELMSLGYVFKSETDTEVIAHLLEKNYQGDFTSAVRKTLGRLEGSYAVAILCRDYPGRIFCCRWGSPIVIAKNENGCFVSSDVISLMKYTDEVYRLEGGESAMVDSDEITFFDRKMKAIEKTSQKINLRVSDAQKKGFDHFMLKEIFEQSETASQTIRENIRMNEIELNCSENLSERLSSVKRIVFVGCGSAYHVCLIGKYLTEKFSGICAFAETASEWRYGDSPLDGDCLAVFISQSGETADTLAALRKAKSQGALTLGIVNVVSSSVACESDYVIYTKAGPEIAVATTKAYTAQLLTVFLLAIKTGRLKGKITDKNYEELISELEKSGEIISSLLSSMPVVAEKLAEELYTSDYIYFLGRNTDYAAAMEGALKLREVSYIPCEAYAAGELKHGTISLIEKGSVVIALMGNKELSMKTFSNIREVKSRGARVIALVQKGTLGTQEKAEADRIIELPLSHSAFSCVYEGVALQLFAYYVAKKRGCDIDKPRNLAKSVTVE